METANNPVAWDNKVMAVIDVVSLLVPAFWAMGMGTPSPIPASFFLLSLIIGALGLASGVPLARSRNVNTRCLCVFRGCDVRGIGGSLRRHRTFDLPVTIGTASCATERRFFKT